MAQKTPGSFRTLSRQTRKGFPGTSGDDLIRLFFAGNGLVAVVVLALITVFLFREGAGFFGQNRDNLRVYRQAGLEYVDIMKRQQAAFIGLTREVSALRLQQFNALVAAGRSVEQANEALAGFDAFDVAFADSVIDLRGFTSELSEAAAAIKEDFIQSGDRAIQRDQLLAAGRAEEAAQVPVDTVDFAARVRAITDRLPEYRELNAAFAAAIESSLGRLPRAVVTGVQPGLDRLEQSIRAFAGTFSVVEQELAAWSPLKSVPWWRSLAAFLFGRDWLTASFWQDWYGILPLFVGSLMVSAVALALAVPFGVGAAIYINQVASRRERQAIKPCIEFIAAVPSVVLGFFGIAVLGETLRAVSQWEALAWVPGFPFSERLNILTAGCLLALMAVPTIFTLAEDALNNVPRSYKEASFALGANRLQTIARIIVPASLSGIISAVLLGLGRVIGETMVVLLCAGNRIAIPDFTEGLGVITQPVHTMTGIIAQEMGEVAHGSIHYRALFMVGLVLFCLSLLINFAAQRIVRRYKLSIG